MPNRAVGSGRSVNQSALGQRAWIIAPRSSPAGPGSTPHRGAHRVLIYNERRVQRACVGTRSHYHPTGLIAAAALSPPTRADTTGRPWPAPTRRPDRRPSTSIHRAIETRRSRNHHRELVWPSLAPGAVGSFGISVGPARVPLGGDAGLARRA